MRTLYKILIPLLFVVSFNNKGAAQEKDSTSFYVRSVASILKKWPQETYKDTLEWKGPLILGDRYRRRAFVDGYEIKVDYVDWNERFSPPITNPDSLVNSADAIEMSAKGKKDTFEFTDYGLDGIGDNDEAVWKYSDLKYFERHRDSMHADKKYAEFMKALYLVFLQKLPSKNDR